MYNITAMVITFPKNRYIRCQVSDVSVLVDPPEGLKGNIIIKTATEVPIHEGSFDIVQGAGEYEIEGMTVRGFQLEAESNEGTIRNAYTVKMEGLLLGFLEEVRGELSEKVLDKIGEIDILFISVGEAYLDTKRAMTLIKQLDPGMVIPLGASKSDILALAEGLGEKPEPTEKVVVKKKDLNNEEGLQFIWMIEK